MSAVEQSLPGLDGALVPGPVFFSMTLLGRPIAWARAGERIVIPRDGRPPFVHHYVDEQTDGYKKAIAQYAAIQMRRKAPTHAPISFLVIADIRVPKSWSARDQAAALEGRLLPTSRPDDDNYAKLPRDALNKIVFNDDAQIVDGRQIKRYSASPALTIEVREFISPPG